MRLSIFSHFVDILRRPILLIRCSCQDSVILDDVTITAWMIVSPIYYFLLLLDWYRCKTNLYWLIPLFYGVIIIFDGWTTEAFVSSLNAKEALQQTRRHQASEGAYIFINPFDRDFTLVKIIDITLRTALDLWNTVLLDTAGTQLPRLLSSIYFWDTQSCSEILIKMWLCGIMPLTHCELQVQYNAATACLTDR